MVFAQEHRRHPKRPPSQQALQVHKQLVFRPVGQLLSLHIRCTSRSAMGVHPWYKEGDGQPMVELQDADFHETHACSKPLSSKCFSALADLTKIYLMFSAACCGPIRVPPDAMKVFHSDHDILPFLSGPCRFNEAVVRELQESVSS